MSLTAEQKEESLDYITGSDCAIILGVSPWGNVIDLWKYKTRIAFKPNNDASKPWLKVGQYLEDAIACWYSDETGKKLQRHNDLIVSKDIPYMGAHIDRRVVGENAILECKTSRTSMGWGEDGENLIPSYYLCQLYHYGIVENCDVMYAAALFKTQDTFRHYTFERNERLESIILQRQKDFWECVQTLTPPAPTTGDEVISLYGTMTDDKPIVSTHEIYETVRSLQSIKESIKEAEEKKAEFEDAIKAYMGKNSTLLSPRGLPCATWKATKPINRFDTTRFKKEQEELYGRYVTTTEGHRTFRVKGE